MTPLHYACANGAPLEVVQLLISKGAKVNQPDEYGSTPLHVACAKGAPLEVVQLLISKGANIHQKNEWGETPLHYACANGASLDVVQLLISKGAKVNQPSKEGLTPLHYACAKGAPLEVVQLLISKGAKVNQPSKEGLTPLHYACAKGAPLEVVQLLISKGANVNERSTRGDTPLHGAVGSEKPSLAVVEYLIIKGANVNEKNKGGWTPLGVAMEYKAPPEVVDLLSIEYLIRHPLDSLDEMDALLTMKGRAQISRIHLSRDSQMTLDLYGLYHAQEGTDFSVTVKDTTIKAHFQILMVALGITTEKELNGLKNFLKYQKDAGPVKAFIRDLYLGGVMQNPGSKKLFDELVKHGLAAKGLKAPRPPVQIMQLLSKKAKDFTITAGKHIRVSSLVLRARSGLFRELFNSIRNDPTHQVNDYSGLSYGAVNEVMHFLHTGCLSAYFDADPEKLKPREIQARVNILNELYSEDFDTAGYYQLTCPKNFYSEIVRARERYAPVMKKK